MARVMRESLIATIVTILKNGHCTHRTSLQTGENHSDDISRLFHVFYVDFCQSEREFFVHCIVAMFPKVDLSGFWTVVVGIFTFLLMYVND